MNSFRFLLMLLGAIVLSGCSGAGGADIITSGERYLSVPNEAEDYRLGVGDTVRMTVYREAELSGEFGVGANGSLSLPLIGEVVAQGRRVGEVAKEAEARLADGYLREPKVSMEIITYRPFFILGEVTQPGSYPYVIGLTVMNAVATAQGFTPRADRSVIRIKRKGATEEERYRLTPELRVYPGDTIRIGERFF